MPSVIVADENSPVANRHAMSESRSVATAHPNAATADSPIRTVTTRSLPKRSPSGPWKYCAPAWANANAEITAAVAGTVVWKSDASRGSIGSTMRIARPLLAAAMASRRMVGFTVWARQARAPYVPASAASTTPSRNASGSLGCARWGILHFLPRRRSNPEQLVPPPVGRARNEGTLMFSRPFAPAVSSVIVAAGIAVLAAGCSREAPPPQRPVPEVTVITVEPRDIPFTPSFVAQTESSRQVNIVARVSGYLDKIAYQEGDVVKEGQLLFQLDPKPFQAQLEAARGELQSQQARFTTAQANLGRVKPLAQQNALSQSDLDRAQGEFDSAKAAVYSAQAKVTEAELNLGYTTIRSPVNGLASRSLQRQGAFVNAQSDSANLTYVAAIDPIWVNFSVSQNQVAKWRDELAKKLVIEPKNRDYEVEIMLSDNTVYPYRGKINFSDPSFSQDTGSFLVRAVLPNPKRDLRPGMFVTAYAKGALRPGAIVVPQLAVQQGSNGHLVYVINQAGNAEVRPVIVGDYYGEKDIVILNGLQAGDRVVVDGVLKVIPGQPVKIVEPGAVGAAKAGAASAKAEGAKKQ